MSNNQDTIHDKRNLSDQDRELYWQLFVNRSDVYAYQNSKGYTRVDSPLTKPVLFSDQTVGTYNLDLDSNVINACLDFDLKKSIHENQASMSTDEWDKWVQAVKQYAKSCYVYIRSLDIPCYLEFSGFKGYHIWFFLDKPMQAAEVRHWLSHVEQLLPARPEGIAKLELFPKQDKISADRYGNLVKFPLQVNLKSGKYSHFLDESFKPIIGLPEITRTGLIELPEIPEESGTDSDEHGTVSTGEVVAEDNLMHSDRFKGILKNCAYIQQLTEKLHTKHHLEHEERIWTGNLLLQFGMEFAINYYQPASDFRREKTRKKLESLNGKPSLCKSSPMCKDEKCPLMKRLKKKKSPIVFAKRLIRREELNPLVPWFFHNMLLDKEQFLYEGKQYGVSKENIKTVCGSFQIELPTKLPSLKPIFSPFDQTFIDLAGHTINTFERSEYERLGKSSQVLVPANDFPTIWQVFSNLAPKSVEREHFINALASAFNTDKKLKVTFLFKGPQGAGKNVMFDHIIAPLFGRSQCRVVDNDQLESQFNSYMHNARFIAFDEVAYDNKTRNSVKNKLKAYIANNSVTINDKGDKRFEADNHMNCIFFSNDAIPVIVEDTDRRFTVIHTAGNLAMLPFFDGDEFFKRIATELLSFAQYLRNYDYDLDRARTVLESEAKRALIAVGMPKIEEFAKKLKENNGEWLKGAIDPIHGIGYEADFADELPNGICRAQARKLYRAIYGEDLSTQALSKKLAVHGISTKKIGSWFYTW